MDMSQLWSPQTPCLLSSSSRAVWNVDFSHPQSVWRVEFLDLPMEMWQLWPPRAPCLLSRSSRAVRLGLECWLFPSPGCSQCPAGSIPLLLELNPCRIAHFRDLQGATASGKELKDDGEQMGLAGRTGKNPLSAHFPAPRKALDPLHQLWVASGVGFSQ